MLNHRLPRLLPLATALLLAACSGNELVGLHVALKPGGAAEITTRALVDTPKPGPAEVTAKGVQWEKNAALVHSHGKVANLAALRFGDESLRFLPRLEGEAPSLRVHIQRGPNAGWVQCLALAKSAREPLARIYDPTGKTKDFADTLRLEVEHSTDVVGSSVLPTARGVEAGRDGKRAWLLIPVATALDGGPELVWDISWK